MPLEDDIYETLHLDHTPSQSQPFRHFDFSRTATAPSQPAPHQLLPLSSADSFLASTSAPATSPAVSPSSCVPAPFFSSSYFGPASGPGCSFDSGATPYPASGSAFGPTSGQTFRTAPQSAPRFCPPPAPQPCTQLSSHEWHAQKPGGNDLDASTTAVADPHGRCCSASTASSNSLNYTATPRLAGDAMPDSYTSSENVIELDNEDDCLTASSTQHPDDEVATLAGGPLPSSSSVFASHVAGPVFHSPYSGLAPVPTKRPRLLRAESASSSNPPKHGRVLKPISKRSPLPKPSGRLHPSKYSANSGQSATSRIDAKIHKSAPGSGCADPEADPDSDLDVATMIGRLRDEIHDQGSVTRQFLPKGNVVASGSPNAGVRTASRTASATSLLSDALPLEPSAVSRGSIWPTVDGSLSSHSLPTPCQSTALQDIGAIELLEQDDRPTFIIDLANTANFRSGRLQTLYSNPALQSRTLIFSLLSGSTGPSPSSSTAEGASPDQDGFSGFKFWLLTYGANQETAANPPAPTEFAGLQWNFSTLRRRFRVVQASNSPNLTLTNKSVTVSDAFVKATAVTIPPSSPVSFTQDLKLDQPSSWSRDSAIATPTPRPATSEDAEVTHISAAEVPFEETGDYFGDTATLSVETNGLGIMEEVSIFTAEQLQPSFDWTRINLTQDLPPHILFARSVNWAATPLGPIELWPTALRTMANMVMGSPHPSVMFWGPEFTIIYNEAYTALAGKKHPQLMGASYPTAWPEFWEVMKPVFHSAWNAGQAILKHDDRFFLNRNGYLEETFFNWSIVPLVGDDGSVVALYNPSFEITRRKLNERRMLTLRELGEKTSTAQTVQNFWHCVQQGLEYNEYDAPFALIYSVAGSSNDDSGSDGSSSMHSGTPPSPPQVVLEGSLGVPSGHPAAVAKLDLRISREGFAPYMRQSMSTASSSRPTSLPTPVVLSAEDGSLPPALVANLEEGHRGFCDPVRNVVVFPVYHRTPPITAATSESLSSTVAGFVVLGTNQRRPYDRDYRLFIHLLARQLTTSLAAVVLFEEEVLRSERAVRRAAQDRQELSQQLWLRTQEAVESENRFMRMAECTPVGMFVADKHGRITYCNDMWWVISRHPKASEGKSAANIPVSPVGIDEAAWKSWIESVEDDDQPILKAIWDRLVYAQAEVTHEFRFKKNTTLTVKNPDDGSLESTEITTWVLLRAAPDRDEKTGELKGIFGCITDISRQKMAAEYQNQRREEAVEHKRQQENFIDITSHEMRNPLSAILQSVDEINSTIETFRKDGNAGRVEISPAVKDLLDSVYEASSTISLCANHQRRIVDDVLTLSKLDSRLLHVAPVDVLPITTLRNTLKMFEAEFNAHDIPCTFIVQPSFQKLIGTHTIVRLDPSRLNQILINLLTNAIKFTQASGFRSLVISLGASGDGVASCKDIIDSPDQPSYIPSSKSGVDMETGTDWGSGPKFNLHIAVTDTGKGLEEDERRMLFQRFSKASPRTHVRYGGSGLGLFICRNLAELQGGQIGVASKMGKGSTFAFYVSCRKAKVEPETVASAHAQAEKQPSISYAPFVAYSVGAPSSQSNGYPQSVLAAPTIALPSAVSAVQPSLRVSTTPITSTPDSLSPATTPVQDFPPVDVLIVEDNLVNQRVLQRQLNKLGNRTRVANHGAEALDALRQSCHWRDNDNSIETAMEIDSVSPTAPAANPAETEMDVDAAINSAASHPPTAVRNPMAASPPGNNISIILMDLEMPVMDGMTCARAIRALEDAGALVRHVPILAVTAYARQEQIASAKAAGIDDVISKPFRLAQLMPKIHELVKKHHTR